MNHYYKIFSGLFFASLFCLTTFSSQSNATDVREKLIVKAYDCSEFVTEATITRPLLPYEYQPIPSLRPVVGFSGGRGSSGSAPISGQRGGGSSGGGLFRIRSHQGIGDGGQGGGATPAGGGPPPAARGQANTNSASAPPKNMATITYKKKDLTELTQFIRTSVDPLGWSEKHARPNIRQIGSILIVTQTQKNHDKIQKLMNMLHDAKKQ